MKKNSILNDDAGNQKNTDLELYYFGTQQCKPGESWGPGIKTQYKLHFVHEGTGHLKAAEKEYTITKGQLFACYPNEIVYYWADTGDPWRYSCRRAGKGSLLPESVPGRQGEPPKL